MYIAKAGLQLGAEGDNKAYYQIDVLGETTNDCWNKALKVYKNFGFNELELLTMTTFSHKVVMLEVKKNVNS